MKISFSKNLLVVVFTLVHLYMLWFCLLLYMYVRSNIALSSHACAQQYKLGPNDDIKAKKVGTCTCVTVVMFLHCTMTLRRVLCLWRSSDHIVGVMEVGMANL